MFYILAFLLSTSAHALVLEPTFEAAESLGYQVVGEMEFQNGTTTIQSQEVDRPLSQIGEMCPRTQSVTPGISSFARFVIMAWSDQDFPGHGKSAHSPRQQWLAEKRALAVAEKVRAEIKGHVEVDLVNMASRKAHMVNSADDSTHLRGRYDIKEVMETSGAAPSDRLGFGLFGEYSQAAKAVVLVNCRESLGQPKNKMPALVRLASATQM